MKQSVLYVISVELACNIKYSVVIEMQYRKLAELWYICDTFVVWGWFSVLCDYTCRLLLDGGIKRLGGEIKGVECLFSLGLVGGGGAG